MRPKTLPASLFLSLLTSGIAMALPAGHHAIVAPSCLVKAAGLTSVTPLAIRGSLVLLEADDNAVSRLTSAKTSSWKAKNSTCGGFRDVTDGLRRAGNDARHFLLDDALGLPANARTFTVQYPAQVKQLLGLSNPQNMWTSLTTLTAFHDRYANSATGIQAADWIKKQLESMSQGREDVSVYTVATHGYKQPSVILKIGTSSGPGVVISGHMDTVSGWGGLLHMPGADDDGSGTVTVLEAARAVLASGMHFKKPLYFMWFAAEEEGLVGSSSVVSEFSDKKIPVDTALHFDMTGFEHQNEPTLYLLRDYTNPAVTDWLATLIKTYINKPVDFTKCGYACSDHASWTGIGVPAGAATETRFDDMNASLHTSEDTMDKLSLSHMTDYMKLAIAFAVETAEPV